MIKVFTHRETTLHYQNVAARRMGRVPYLKRTKQKKETSGRTTRSRWARLEHESPMECPTEIQSTSSWTIADAFMKNQLSKLTSTEGITLYLATHTNARGVNHPRYVSITGRKQGISFMLIMRMEAMHWRNVLRTREPKASNY